MGEIETVFLIFLCVGFIGTIIFIGTKYISDDKSSAKEISKNTVRYVHNMNSGDEISEYKKLFDECKSYPNYLNYKCKGNK